MRYLLVIAAAGLVGCGVAEKPSPQFHDAPTVARASGEWEDINAAVLAGAIKNEMGPLDDGEADGAGRKWAMVTSSDEPARVRAWREGDEIVLEARVGRFGDARRERALLKTIVSRLATLKGKDFAPLPGYP